VGNPRKNDCGTLWRYINKKELYLWPLINTFLEGNMRLLLVFSLIALGFTGLNCANNAADKMNETAVASAEMVVVSKIDTSIAETDRLEALSPEGMYGEDLTLTESTTIADLFANAASLEGKRVQVKATVKESCPKRGCWVNLEQDGKEIKVKVTDGDIVFPKSSVGYVVMVEGIVEKMDLDLEATKKYLAHEAEETGREFDESTVTEPMVTWRIKGDAAKIQK